MDLLKHLKKNQLRPLWQFTATGVLWQIHADSPLYIVGEDRNLEKKQVAFFCLDRSTGVPLWTDLRLEETWWVGIEAVQGSHVIFHGFASPDLPLHRGVTVADVCTGRILWTNSEVRYLSGTETSLVVARDLLEGVELLELDAHTGRSLSREGIGPDVSAGSIPPPGAGEGTQLPEVLLPGSAGFSRCERFVNACCPPENLLPPVEFLERGDAVILAVHFRSSAGGRPRVLSRLFLLGPSTAVPLFEETLHETADPPAGQSYFVQHDVLYYVKHRSILVALPLAG
jgi:hypothetical protein